MLGFRGIKINFAAIAICSLLAVISLFDCVHGQECEDFAGAAFCQAVQTDCYNENFQDFYMDQCAKTCGMCSQRSLRSAAKSCSPVANVWGAVKACTNGYNDGSMCTVTCQDGSKIKAISPTNPALPITSETYAERMCLCHDEGCEWLGGADFLFCDTSVAARPIKSNIESGWGEWAASGGCSASCGGGEMSYTRTCNGNNCLGDDMKYESCNPQPCPNWSEWEESGSCSKTCGGGVRNLIRTCPVDGGCPGLAVMPEKCNTDPCVDKCEDMPTVANAETTCTNTNNHLSSCTTKCNGLGAAPGVQTQLCVCTGGTCKWYGPTGLTCQRQAPAPTTAAPLPEWSPWSTWTACSATCGRGEVSRMRECSGDGCEGSSTETKTCLHSDVCPCSCKDTICENKLPRICRYNASPRRCLTPYIEINCQKTCGKCKKCQCGTWSEWSPNVCNAACGKGEQIFTRTCPEGKTCDGEAIKRESCEGSCTQDCGPLDVDPNASSVCQRSTQVGQICTVSCNDGYVSLLAKPEAKQTCACYKGVCGWMGMKMKCEAESKTSEKTEESDKKEETKTNKRPKKWLWKWSG